jgi:hypothetical protein
VLLVFLGLLGQPCKGVVPPELSATAAGAQSCTAGAGTVRPVQRMHSMSRMHMLHHGGGFRKGLGM